MEKEKRIKVYTVWSCNELATTKIRDKRLAVFFDKEALDDYLEYLDVTCQSYDVSESCPLESNTYI